MRAQSAATVPASSELYDRLESVSAWFPVRGVFLGERPISERAARRALRLLQQRVDSAKADGRRDWALTQLALVASALGERSDSSAATAWSWRGGVAATNARVERIEPNGLGGFDTTTQRFIGIDALRNSFDAERDGVPLDRTTAFALPTFVAGGGTLAALLEPLLATTGTDADSGRWAPLVHRAYGRVVFHNAALRVGSDEVRWGQSTTGALFGSGNAAPLPAITIGTDTPVTLPWLFRLAGPFRITAQLADLGAGQAPRHDKLAGWQASIEPWSRFELGVAVLAQTGGAGSPPASFLEQFVDLFPIIDALAPQHADLQISNKLAGGNLRLRFPELSGLDFYYELQIDDFDGRRLRSSLVEDAGHLLGLRLPLLIGGRQLAWRAEWQRTSLRLYEHSQFRSGVTYHDRLIGNPLGPNAKGAYLSGNWELSATSHVELSLADERRNPTFFGLVSSDSLEHGFRFFVDSLLPDHRRDRVVGSLDRPVGPFWMRLNVGAARSWQRTQPGRTEWLLEIVLRKDYLRTF